MFYLSAQPDQTYFIWQLEIQLRNFCSIGITKDQIQVLVSFKPEIGVNPNFQSFIDQNAHLATFYTYPDLRKTPKYTSSIRLNILKQHFEQYPELENETLFYHDSDILFSRIPQIQNVESNAICYVSDTRNYLDIHYIRQSGSEQLLTDMAGIVGIPIEIIEKNQQHTGGAQYILKGINASFWEKVENDSEALYVLMKDYNKQLWEATYPEKKEYKSKKRGIQAWCADMWAVLWNLWLMDKKVEIHPEMDFSWPFSGIEEWNKKAIQHYSGNIKEKEKFFKKTEYLNYMPWYDESLLSIPDTNCSYKIVELIRDRQQELDNHRCPFPNSCIVLDGRGFEYGFESFQINKLYIQKYIAIDIFLLTDDKQQTMQCDVFDSNRILDVPLRSYDGILWMSLEYVLDIKDIQNILRSDYGKSETVFMPKDIYKVDSLFLETFSKVLDIDLLHVNNGKFNMKEQDQRRAICYMDVPNDMSKRSEQLNNMLLQDNQRSITAKVIPVVYSLII